jgi:hypothetical protein
MVALISTVVEPDHLALHPQIEEILAEEAEGELEMVSFGALIQFPLILIVAILRSGLRRAKPQQPITKRFDH